MDGFLSQLVVDYGLYGLFINIFLSYSILPTFTEIPMVFAIQFFHPWTVFVVSLVASTLGSITNYYIGFQGIRRFFPKTRRLRWAEKMDDNYGGFAILLFCWLPFIGDPLIIAAGTLRMNFWYFLGYSTISKVWYLATIIFFGIVLF